MTDFLKHLSMSNEINKFWLWKIFSHDVWKNFFCIKEIVAEEQCDWYNQHSEQMSQIDPIFLIRNRLSQIDFSSTKKTNTETCNKNPYTIHQSTKTQQLIIPPMIQLNHKSD